jgi:hypothetical protein
MRENRTPPTTPPAMAATGTEAAAGSPVPLLVLLLVVISTSAETENAIGHCPNLQWAFWPLLHHAEEVLCINRTSSIRPLRLVHSNHK